MRTDQLVHFSMDHHEVVDHPLVISAVDAAVGTNRFADEQLQMRQKMQSEFVVAAVELPVANTAGWWSVFLPQNESGFLFDDSLRIIVII